MKSKHPWNLEVIYKYPAENQEKGHYYLIFIIGALKNSSKNWTKCSEKSQKKYDKIINAILSVIKNTN